MLIFGNCIEYLYFFELKFMNKIYHLSTCDTCKRILKQLSLENVILQDIKTEAISEEQLEEMRKRAGSYEALFSRRARKYKALGLKEMSLSEEDYKKYLLEEYTFLKRPVALVDDAIYIGNSKKVVSALVEVLG